jgi:hypothetical protein
MKVDNRFFIIVIIFAIFMLCFNAFISIPAVHNAIATATATPYADVPVYGIDETPFYTPLGASSFVPINNFKEMTTWRDNSYGNDANVSILVDDEKLLFAGRLKESTEASSAAATTWREINVELLCLEISTGKVIWQDWVGEANLATDGTRLYAQATNNFDDAGLVAYEIDSGKKLWETRFTGMAGGVSAFWPLGSDLYVTAYNRGYYSSYVLDQLTGEIKQTYAGEKRFVDDGTVVSNGIGLKREGYGVGPINAYKIGTQEPLWTYFQGFAISNIAIDNRTSYWITSSGRLVGVDIQTGQTLTTLEFSPRFASDFDYLNKAPIVAAGNGYVVIYFADKQQLSVFRVANPG